MSRPLENFPLDTYAPYVSDRDIFFFSSLYFFIFYIYLYILYCAYYTTNVDTIDTVFWLFNQYLWIWKFEKIKFLTSLFSYKITVGHIQSVCVWRENIFSLILFKIEKNSNFNVALLKTHQTHMFHAWFWYVFQMYLLISLRWWKKSKKPWELFGNAIGHIHFVCVRWHSKISKFS